MMTIRINKRKMITFDTDCISDFTKDSTADYLFANLLQHSNRERGGGEQENI